MIHGYWILDADKRPVRASLIEWGEFFQTHDRIVAKTLVGNANISTVFLGIDHNWGDGPPLLFETMIFGGVHDDYQVRSSTWRQAEYEHEKACSLVRESSARKELRT